MAGSGDNDRREREVSAGFPNEDLNRNTTLRHAQYLSLLTSDSWPGYSPPCALKNEEGQAEGVAINTGESVFPVRRRILELVH